jgi:hypothetical protein
LKVILLTDRDSSGEEIPLGEIDPFTFFASFNRMSSVSGRQAILARIKAAWQLPAPVPNDFDGIPIANAQNSWAFAYLANRTPNDIPILWRAAREGVEQGWQTFDRSLFDEALSISQMGLAKLTMSLFRVNPHGFLSCDKHTGAYFKRRGIVLESKMAAGYFPWLEKAIASAGENFPQVSLDAYEADAAADEESNGDHTATKTGTSGRNTSILQPFSLAICCSATSRTLTKKSSQSAKLPRHCTALLGTRRLNSRRSNNSRSRSHGPNSSQRQRWPIANHS